MRNLVIQTDFGTGSLSVGAMHGVCAMVSQDLKVADGNNDVAQFNVLDASESLMYQLPYWPTGTVFVSVVDPGVGSNRKSVVAKTSRGQYIVTPNNGTLTHIKRFVGIEELREIEEKTNRLANSELSYTFHGRDVYAYTGARLAAGVIDFAGVGPRLDVEETIMLDLYGSSYEDGAVKGQIDILDVRFGSLWTSITFDDFKKLNASFGEYLEVQIFNHKTMVYSNRVIYGHSFADVMIGAPIIYMNSVNHMALAINQGSFAKAYNVGVGSSWEISFRKI